MIKRSFVRSPFSRSNLPDVSLSGKLSLHNHLPTLYDSPKVSVDLAFIIPTIEELQIGIPAMIQTQNGHETYWALAYPAPSADFHLRKSFILELAAQTHPSEQSAQGG